MTKKLRTVGKLSDFMRNSKRNVIVFLAVFMLVAIALESSILILITRINEERTGEMQLAQVENILKSNAKDEKAMISDMKRNYQISAKSVAYFLELNPATIYNVQELCRLAKTMGIDEINLFDITGRIYSGTVPKYYGYSFESGDQMGYFKPMLRNKKLSMCQDVTPNTAEGKNMMYAITWNNSGTCMIQVGVEPKRLMQELRNNDISNVVKNMTTNEGINIVIADSKSGRIKGATESTLIGKNVKTMGFPMSQNPTHNFGVISGKHCYFTCKPVGSNIVMVTSTTQDGRTSGCIAIIIAFVYLLIACCIIYYYAGKLLKANNDKKTQLKELGELYSQLENATAEQEMQIEEITTLNKELEEHQKQLEQAELQEKEYNEIISNAGFGIWHIYLKEGMTPRMQANDKMAELLAINAEEMKEEDVYDAWYSHITPDAIPSVQKSVEKMKMGHFSENTYLWNHPAKGNIYVRCGGTSVMLPDGTCMLRGYHADMTEVVKQKMQHVEEITALNKQLKKAREDADAANDAKTSFLFNMSHDIRTPMNAIIGFRDLLEKHQNDPERRASYLQKIKDSSEILLSIINNVLEMARIEKGTLEIVETAWNAEQFNDMLFIIFEDMMKQKGLTFTRQIDVQNDYVLCDSIKLREIMINLLSNAYKYTNSGGSVNMSLKEIPCDRDGWTLYQTTISDTGIGMSEEFIPHLFEEFSREHNSTETKIEGTGLGMPIVKRLVEMLDGTIDVKSKKGEGTTFIVTIPHRIADKTELVDHSGVKVDPKMFEGKRVLLAEDNELNAEIATEILSEAGFITEHATDGIICLEMISKAPADYYDVILMDIQMPNMNGYDATKKIRSMQDKAKSRIPILAMTANAFEEDRRQALRSGMNGHLAKPIDVSEMMKQLAIVLC